jgi:16S rRNA A1518/A1519 N6-dimethyltransferase RsmA/KsgA/DIM1 with predicted DNA glycosylase/AP lyase activity
VAGRRARRARPPRARSQHFLRTSTLAAELVDDACLGPGDVVVDLGAGSGRLTAELARVAREVVAVELDPRWAARLRGRWPNVRVVEGDAVEVQLPSVPFHVVANIPFDRTTDLLRRLLDDPRVPLGRADLIVEWGVAVKRALPWPSTVNDARWGAWYRFSISRRLSRADFAPPPLVDAGVLVIERRVRPLVPEREAAAYSAFVARGFRHGLRTVVGRRAPRGVEPRDLDPHRWAQLYLSVRGGGTGARASASIGAAAASRARAGAARPNGGTGTDRSGRSPSAPQ